MMQETENVEKPEKMEGAKETMPFKHSRTDGHRNSKAAAALCTQELHRYEPDGVTRLRRQRHLIPNPDTIAN